MDLLTRPHTRGFQIPQHIRLAVVLFCALLTTYGSPLYAQELKVGYVNLAKIFDGYQRTKTSDAALEKKGKDKETELEGRVSELKKLRQNLELLKDDVRESKTREIEEKTEELQRFRTNAARDLGRERDKIAKDLLKEIQEGIDEYAKAQGFSFVFDERSLLYGQPAYDITDKALAMLNSRSKPAAAPAPAR